MRSGQRLLFYKAVHVKFTNSSALTLSGHWQEEPMPRVSETWKHEFVTANDLRFHCITQGQGPLLMLLHGFPENHYSWRYQMAPLAAHFKVVAPDLRGYNLSERKGPYDIKTLCADVMGLIRAFSSDRAIIAGHDWGAIILWNFAL